MIGFAVTQVKAQEANDAVALAQESRGLPVFWLPGQYPIVSGMYSGLVFVPCDDQILDTPLRGNPPLTPADFPEFTQIIDDLGGMSARVTISPSDLIPTE
jgi:hypothetical protein